MSEQLKEYHSSFTGQEVDALLTKVKDGSITADIEKELADKADKSGYYPQLSVGQADNLPDRGDVTEGFVGFRESAGAGNSIEDGTANVVELLGESLVWNQKLQWRGSGSIFKGLTVTYEDEKIHVQGTPEETAIEFYSLFFDDVEALPRFQKNHYYLIRGASEHFELAVFRDVSVIGSNCITQKTGDAMRLRLVGENLTVGQEVNESFSAQVIDLTQMFGAGKEPSTIEEFNAVKNQLVGVDFNAYNAGEVLGVNIKGIKSVNDNAWDEQWENGRFNTDTGAPNSASGIRTKNPIKVLPNAEYYCNYDNAPIFGLFYDAEGQLIQGVERGNNFKNIRKTKFTTPANAAYMRFYVVGITTYNHDICIRLAHSGYKTDYVAHAESESSFDLTKYFPNGMHGIGAVRDSVTPKKATRRFGVVDMGTLHWAYNPISDAYPYGFMYTNLSKDLLDKKKGGAVLCHNYTMGGFKDDHTIGINTVNTIVYVKDSAYTDAASFKAAMSGVMLYYELATPIETEIDPQLNMNYKVWDFGTEELLTDSKSAPVLARTIYGFNATDTIRGNKATNEEQDARIHTLETEVVRKGDYSPDNSVGFADDLVGRGESVPAEFSFRASGGKSIKDGRAYIKRIKGNSVVWNQLWDINGDNRTDNVANMTINEGEVVLTIQGRGNNSRIRTAYTIGVVGHKYYVTYQAKYNSKSDDSSLIAFVGMSNSYANQLPLTNSYQTYSGIWVGDYAGSMNVGVIGTRNDGDIVSFKDIKVIDLTQMFQAGNEPSTIEEFYARKPIVEDEYAYNEGEVIHCNTESIKSVGDNAWDEEWELGKLNSTGVPSPNDTQIRSKNFTRVIPNETYYFNGVFGYGVYFYDSNKNYVTTLYVNNNKLQIPSNAMYLKFNFPTDYGTTYKGDYMITLVHSGWKQDTDAGYQPYWQDTLPLPIIRKYFPDGMKSAGSAHDEIRYNKASGKWEKVVRIGSVDLGTLKWRTQTIKDANYFASENNTLNAVISDDRKNNERYILCAKYQALNRSEGNTQYDSKEDKVIMLNHGCFGNVSSLKDLITIRDTSYTDAESFKAAMQGVMLYYELAEPIVTELDAEDQNFRDYYQVADFGTEMSQSAVPSAAFSADIIYQFNAVDMIREHEIEIAELQSIIATMQAQLASLTSNNIEE